MKFTSFSKFAVLLLLISFFVFSKFTIDPDFGWHIATGKEFLESGRIITSDEFSWTMPGYIWGNSYFLYQIFVTFIFENFGQVAAGFVFGLIGVIAILLLIPKRLDFGGFLAGGLGMTIASANIGIRPHNISFLMFALLLIFLEKRFFTRRIHIALWFLFFVFWANFHRAFLVGLMVLGMYLLFDFFQRKSLGKKPSFVLPFLIFTVSVLGTLITPFPFDVWQTGIIGDVISHENIFGIAEWQGAALFFPLNLLMAVSGVWFIYLFWKNFKKKASLWFLLAPFLFAAAFIATVFVFFWAAIFVFVMTRNVSFSLKGSFFNKLPTIIALFALASTIFLNFILNIYEASNLNNLFIASGYPVGAVIFFKENHVPIKLFNEYEWGGFLDWQIPQGKVFIDGRMASWRKDKRAIFNDYNQIYLGKDCNLVNLYEIEEVLIKKESKAPCFLGWEQVYEDNNSKILLKK